MLRKIRTSPSWPRRGRRGLRLRRGAFSHGCSGSYGGRAFAASRKFDLLQSPGFEAPARTVGKYSREVERRLRNSHKEGTVTDSGYKKPGGAFEHRGGRRDRRRLSWGHSSGGGTP